MEQNFIDLKELKVYPKSYKKAKNVFNNETDNEKQGEKVPLTTQNAVKYLLDGTLRLRVCRYCLNVTSMLSELDEVLVIAVNGSLHEVTVRDMVASFHPFKVNEDKNVPNKICTDCLNHTIDCYLFTQKCEQAERALRNCFDDIYEKFEKLDPLEPVKKRGKRKQNPNHNTLYTEHENVINYAEPVINIVNVDSFPVSNTEISDLECQKCWQTLPNMESLLNHEKSHPKSMWYTCKLCGKSFVKRYHLKKHIKENHLFDDDDVEPPNPEQFKCNECSQLNNTLGEHLQHLEKHKFKAVFEHLIERKVDNLCSVCLEKGSRMTSLSEVISFYGGYPDLIGDKPIQNILNTTIPEQNLYKYKELLLPNQATIVRIQKKSKQKCRFTLNHNENGSLQRKDLSFQFSYPIIVIEKKYFILNDDFISYTFAKPLLVNPFRDSNVMKEEQEVVVVNSLEIENNTLNKETNMDKTGNVTSDYVKIDTTFETVNNNNGKVQEIVQSCKLCWVFKKPTCKDCLNATKSTEDNVIKKYQTNDCKFCWLFEKSKKCDYCNKSNEILKIIANSNEICKLCWLFGEIGKCVCKVNKENTLNTETTHISDDKSNESIDQKSHWQCDICLINNINRYSCVCCDKNHDNMEKVNINFGKKLFQNELKEHSIEAIKEIKDNKNDKSIVLFQTKLEPTYDQEEDIGNENKIAMEHNKYNNLHKTNEANSLKTTINNQNEDISMEIEITPSSKIDGQTEENDEELMDFEENETQIVINQENTVNIANEFIKGFNFNIGSGVSYHRRVKRPLRRMATRFQK
ncbi:unnamed protein product, partial [Brenthis ino]